MRIRSTLVKGSCEHLKRSVWRGRLHVRMRSTPLVCQVDSKGSCLDEVDSGGHRVDSTEDFLLIQVKSYGYESTLCPGCVDSMTLIL
ncbi:hypothetical protein Taro_001378 [Colocasia esculenta]|uniref:Uncharacterized protein n=1 Tax=Colocasia esculenta TaxID=4460 RepID=A0A843TEC9_COLES|nr:hypothetical protein [Colocasia esculenta]